MDRLDIEAQVTDEAGNPLVGGVLWFVGRPFQPAPGMGMDAAGMTRMMRRFYRQSDFLNIGDIPETTFYRTNLRGVFRYSGEARGLPDNRYHYIFVATKRGYLPELIEGAAPLNEHHVVAIKLKRDPQSTASPQMEEFDRLMAQAHSTEPDEDLIGDARMRKLDRLRDQVRDLAQSLERNGMQDDASAVYWNLADLPEVIRVKSPDGGEKAVGYRNGGDGAEAEADRVRAEKLNASVPKLLIDKIIMEQGFARVGIHDASAGLAYLETFNKFAFEAGANTVLPRQYEVALFQSVLWGSPDQSCDLIQRTYRYEPATMPVNDWWLLHDLLKTRRKTMGLSERGCALQGLKSLR